MFSGIRGIGKTTTARIVAKTINCRDLREKDGYYLSCEECENCLAINEEKHPDIIELDAASKNSVHDIKEVTENAMYRPIQARYKVYVIDEVHMLSKSAFNALLKILEEPPEHTKFILATTEIRKVPITILSRCQRFDLKRLSLDNLFYLLSRVCQQEGVEYEDKALNLIARHSEGSARDALSLLDQVISSAYFAGKNLTEALARSDIGIPDEEQVLNILENLARLSPKELLDNLSEANNQGKDIISIIENLLEFMGELIKISSAPGYKPELEESTIERLNAISGELPLHKATIMFKLISKALNEEIKQAHDTKLSAEMVLLRALYNSTLPSPAEIIERMGGENDSEFPSS
jgi:DNA polymerase-3 subunit gamma/tau